jgi:hypothetical protein
MSALRRPVDEAPRQDERPRQAGSQRLEESTRQERGARPSTTRATAHAQRAIMGAALDEMARVERRALPFGRRGPADLGT